MPYQCQQNMLTLVYKCSNKIPQLTRSITGVCCHLQELNTGSCSRPGTCYTDHRLCCFCVTLVLFVLVSYAVPVHLGIQI